MFTYAFKVLNEKKYKKLATEEFENTSELFAEILIIAISSQIKRGLERDYVNKSEELTTVRGRIDITKSMNSFIKNKQLCCEYDEFTLNSLKNQIIKSSVYHLFRTKLSKERKHKLKKLMFYFSDVDLIDLNHVNWRGLSYDKNNQTYQMIISICYLAYNNLLQNQDNGNIKLMDFENGERMSKLYEKLIFEYYKREHPEIKAEASQIKWQLDDEFDTMLPIMQSDITLSDDNTILIIDAKYYDSSIQENWDTPKVISHNLYQIFTYVKNKEYELKDVSHSVSGMLLYAGTDDEIQPDYTYNMSGNKISAKTLNLNVDFNIIKEQLDNIIYEYFDNSFNSDSVSYKTDLTLS